MGILDGQLKEPAEEQQEETSLLRQEEAEKRAANTKIQQQRLAILKRAQGPSLNGSVSLLKLGGP